LSFRIDINPPPARWECGNPALLFYAGFPSPVERVENSLWVFEFSTLSTGRHFHGAFISSFSERSDAEGAFNAALVPWSVGGSFFRSGPKSEVSSQKSCARIG
jgi:hypothetical protein